MKTAAWTRKEGKDAKGGLNAKGVASYKDEHPGNKIKPLYKFTAIMGFR